MWCFVIRCLYNSVSLTQRIPEYFLFIFNPCAYCLVRSLGKKVLMLCVSVWFLNVGTDRFPVINSLVQRINLRKRRDSIILGGVIAVCFILLILYAFHWPPSVACGSVRQLIFFKSNIHTLERAQHLDLPVENAHPNLGVRNLLYKFLDNFAVFWLMQQNRVTLFLSVSRTSWRLAVNLSSAVL